jgi:hypothetical protein
MPASGTPSAFSHVEGGLAVDAGNQVYESTDDGMSWNVIATMQSTQKLYGISGDGTNVWVSGFQTDPEAALIIQLGGGVEFRGGVGIELHDIEMTVAGTGYAVGNGMILRRWP